MLSVLFLLINIILNLQQYILSQNNSYIPKNLCLRVAENQVYHPAFQPAPGYCDGWLCWHSQLTLESKIKITDIINKFRNNNGALVSNMNLLLWHWALEQEAIKASRTCVKEDLENYLNRRFIEGLGYSLLCENGCMYKELKRDPSQILFLGILPKLLEENGLQDFDEFNRYRRANVQFFGCCLVVRNTETKDDSYANVFNFVCVFCSKEEQIATKFRSVVSEPPKCSPDTVYGGDKNYPNLCKLKYHNSLYMCTPKLSCPSDLQKPKYWQEHGPGVLGELILMETQAGPVLFINQTETSFDSITNIYSTGTSSFFIDTSGNYLKILEAYPPVSKFVYYYPKDILQSYKLTVETLNVFNEKVMNPITTINEELVVNVPSDAIYTFGDAWCCFYVFVLSGVCVFALIIIFCFTATDYIVKIFD